MKANQYMSLVRPEVFVEYKEAKEIGNDAKMLEIEDFVFKAIRSINEYPSADIDFNDKVKIALSIKNMVVEKHYDFKNNIISPGIIGHRLCYHFYPNIWDIVKTKPNGEPMMTMRETFFDDKGLKLAIRLNLTYDPGIEGIGNWLRFGSNTGYGMNFKPTNAKVIYELNLPKGSKVLDYSSGYGGRIFGAWGTDSVAEYIGIEPNSETNSNGHRFHNFLSNTFEGFNRFELYKIGSEDFTIKDYPQYEGYFDMAFSSPPYFNLEVYSNEETQSYNKFPDYSGWVKHYLAVTINNCIDMLKPDGIFAVNIYEGVAVKNIKQIITYVCKERDFYLYKEDKLKLTTRPGVGSKERIVKGKFEPVWYFRRREFI